MRDGLNAGEPIEEDGDLFGSTVILASRIAAKAGAGEILLPEPVRHLLSGKSFVFSDRGEFVPKGFDDAVRLYQVGSSFRLTPSKAPHPSPQIHGAAPKVVQDVPHLHSSELARGTTIAA